MKTQSMIPQKKLSPIPFAAAFLAGTLVGATSSFFFDPVRGRARRAILRDKARSMGRDALVQSEKIARDMANRAEGLVAEVAQSFKAEEPVDDETLIQRVRSEFGRVVTASHAIDVNANDGFITLTGWIIPDEVDALISCVNEVPGVKGVINQLDLVNPQNQQRA